VHFDAAVVVDEAKLSEFVHKKAHPSARSADHFCKRFLADLGDHWLRLSFLPEIRQQQKQSRKPFLTRVEQLINQVLFDTDGTRQEVGYEQLREGRLVVDQVGTNDALRHVAIDGFKSCLTKTLAWLKEQHVDVVLINPQYGDALIKDAFYEQVVAAIADVAVQSRVLLVDRFDAMRKLQRENGDRVYLSADHLHMNDEGYQRLAEQLAATIIRALPEGVGNVAEARVRRLGTRDRTRIHRPKAQRAATAFIGSQSGG
jgi:lysophospholipase L1-like esterase